MISPREISTRTRIKLTAAAAARTTQKTTISSTIFYRPRRMLQRQTSSSWTHRAVPHLVCRRILRASRPDQQLTIMWTLIWNQPIRPRSRHLKEAVATRADLNATVRIVSRLIGLSRMPPSSRSRNERCTVATYPAVARSTIKPVTWRPIWDGTQVNFDYISF